MVNITIARVLRALWLFEARVVRLELDQSKPRASNTLVHLGWMLSSIIFSVLIH